MVKWTNLAKYLDKKCGLQMLIKVLITSKSGKYFQLWASRPMVSKLGVAANFAYVAKAQSLH